MSEEKSSRLETIKTVLLIVSTAVSIFLAVVSYNLDHKAKALQIQNSQLDRDLKNLQVQATVESQRPRISQGRLVIRGKTLREMRFPTGDTPGIYGFPQPLFVEFGPGRKLYTFLNQLKPRDPRLDPVEAEFLTFRNDGKIPIEDLRLQGAGTSESRLLRTLDPGHTAFVPVSFAPIPDQIETAPQFSGFAYRYRYGNEDHDVREQIPEKGPISWIATVGVEAGLGMAHHGEGSPSLERQLNGERPEVPNTAPRK